MGLGQGHNFFGPTIAPQKPAARLLVGEEGFDNVGLTSLLVLILHSINIRNFPLARGMCQIKGHSFTHPRGVLLHFYTRGAPSRGSSDPTVTNGVGT